MKRSAAVFFQPAPDRVITEMLRLAEIHSGDLVYDLGCGDGRILVAAARQGAKGVGIEIDAHLVECARRNAIAAGVQHLLTFVEGDLFEADLSRASVIALYLLDSLNIQLRPQILSQCEPGTRVVSYSFGMDDWQPDAHTPIAANGVSLWIVPARLEGDWSIRHTSSRLQGQQLRLKQRFQHVFGSLDSAEGSRASLSGLVSGKELAVNLVTDDGHIVGYSGRLHEDVLLLTSDEGDSLIADRVFET